MSAVLSDGRLIYNNNNNGEQIDVMADGTSPDNTVAVSHSEVNIMTHGATDTEHVENVEVVVHPLVGINRHNCDCTIFHTI